MVKRTLLLIFLMISTFAQAKNSSITATIEERNHIEFQPLKGLISITHPKEDAIDTQSFRIEGHPLQVDLIRDVVVSPGSPLVISFYRFTLPGKSKGLYVLPSITANIGNQTYSTTPSSYEVGALGIGESPSGASLKFENIIDGKTTLYPGQHIRLGYRYTYTGKIDLTEETLPLLEAAGLIKIGAKAIKDFAQKQLNVREVSQEFEAGRPGSYTLGPSSVSGLAYQENFLGQRVYLQPQIQAGAPAITISVKPFPEEGKPASFNGAVGPFDIFKVRLLSSPTPSVGDKILLSIEIGGKGQLQDVPLPEVCCQPGYSGHFRVSDLPPPEEMKGPNLKLFQVELHLLSPNVKEIPPLEFAYFDPTVQHYQILRSQPIPLAVTTTAPPPSPVPSAVQIDTAASHGNVAQQLIPIEIRGIQTLDSSDLKNFRFGTWNIFWILPLALAGLLLQLVSYKIWNESKSKIKVKTAHQLLLEAEHLSTGSPEFYRKVGEALITRLKERKLISSTLQHVQELPEEGIARKVKEFLLTIEEKRFTGHEEEIRKTAHEQARTLFEEI